MGRGTSLPRGTSEYASLLASAFGNEEPLGSRQIVRIDIDLVQTSCGYGMPLFDYAGERDTLRRWAERKGEAGLEEYWRLDNARSIDGLATGLVEEGNAPASVDQAAMKTHAG